jgi:dihydroorotate dehydrogenase (NAD+) catalytic subunit
MNEHPKLGGRTIAPPFTIPSGIVTVNPGLIAEAAERIPIGLITTKSVGVEPYDGYAEPLVSQWSDGSLSTAVGLSTMGCDEWAREMASVYPLAGRFLLTSVFGKNVEEFLAAVRAVLPVSDGIELNFCCPHSLEYGESVARQKALTVRITREVRGICGKPVVAKLSPNLSDIGGWARQLVDAGADAIAAIGPTTAVTVADPTTGVAVLSFGKGGLSGRAIVGRGVECVAEIRAAVQVPIVAGGGIESADDVRAYRAAGGDIFAVGTALAGMDTRTMAAYFAALDRDMAEESNRAVDMVRYRNLQLAHRPMTVASVTPRGAAAELRFRKSMEVGPGQFIFAWIPGVGEKPFSVAGADPLLLGVRAVGPVSRALCALRVGDRLLVRGPFGKPFPSLEPEPVLVAGGCGTVPLRMLAERSRAPTIVLGARTAVELLFAEDFARFGNLVVMTDDGTRGGKGTAVDGIGTLARERNLRGRQFVACGPEAMLVAAMEEARKWTPPSRVLLCVERHTSCGIGICGKCSLDGRRTCVDGPWFSGVDLLASREFGRFHRGPSGRLDPLRTNCEPKLSD